MNLFKKNKKTTVWLDITMLKRSQMCGMGIFAKMYLDILKDKYNLRCFHNPFMNFPHQNKFYWLYLNTYFFIKTVILKPEIIIFPAYFMPTLVRKKTSYYTVFLDLMPYRPKFFPGAQKSFLRQLKIANKNAKKIITISNTVKNQFIEELGIKEEKLAVTYICVNELIKNAKEDLNILNKLNLKPNSYIFSLAGSWMHKNTKSLFEAMNKLKGSGTKLVVAGYKGNLRYSGFNNENTIYTGYLTTEEVVALYKNAKFFVMPSLEEGFGLPIIEAQYFNSPVLCSDIPIFKEIAGNSAEFCQTDSNSIAEKIDYLIENPDRLSELKKLGKENIKRFDIEIIKSQLYKIIGD